MGAWVELQSAALMHAPTETTITPTSASVPAISQPPVTPVTDIPVPEILAPAPAALKLRRLMAAVLVGPVLTVAIVLTAITFTNTNQDSHAYADPIYASNTSAASAPASVDAVASSYAPPTTASAAPPTAVGGVQLGQSVQNDPRATAVGEMSDRYFSGINAHDYASALSVEDPNGALDPGNATEVQKFEQGVQTTRDTAITLVSLGPADTSTPATGAVVTFQSSQAAGYGPAAAPDETCTNWTLSYVLTPEAAGSYLIYRVSSATDSGC